MKKQDAMAGSMDLLVLKILSRRPGLHGYGIMTAIRTISDDVLSAEEGSLYPALHRMEKTGLIKADWVERENGKRTRSYKVTPLGRKHLVAEETRWKTVSVAVNKVLLEA